MDGIVTHLYRLPAVRATAKRGGTIYLAEGEKSVDAVDNYSRQRRRRKMTVTTAPGGAARRIEPHWIEELRGAGKVVVIADNDQPGYKRAVAWLDALTGAGIAARVVRSATTNAHDDLVDHLDAGHSFGDL